MKPEDSEPTRTLFENALDALIGIDDKGLIGDWNRQAEVIFGLSKKDVVGRKLSETIMPVRFREAHEAGLRRFLETGNGRILNRRIELVALRNDGAEFPIELSVTPIRKDGSFVFYAFIRDISERKKSEAMLLKQTERVKSVVDHVIDGIITINEKFQIEAWNSAAQKIFGYEEDEVFGRNVNMLMPEPYHSQHDTYVSNYLHTGKAKIIGIGREVTGRRKDGSTFPMDLAVSEFKLGEQRFFTGIVRDITDRKRQEERFKTIVESVPTGIVMVDAAGKINLCNSETEKMFGYAREELIGKPVETLVPIRYQKSHPGHRMQFGQQPQKRQMGAGRDLSGLRKDGSEFPVEIGLNPIQTSVGNFILAAILDITERKGMEEKLREAYDQVQQKSQEMEQFVYTVSHDLKAPLVTSASFVGFLREDIKAKNFDEVMDSLERLDRSHKRMQELINDLLQLSRVGRIDLEIEKNSLGAMFANILELNGEKIKQSKMRIILPDDLPEIFADKKRTQQVFENLLSNALKYASDVREPEMQILWKDTGKEIQICVKDNGPGIEPQYHDKIFGLFQRLQTDKEGTGVGLTIVSRIMQLHGGRVWIDSDLSRGSEFWVAFPKTPAKEGGK